MNDQIRGKILRDNNFLFFETEGLGTPPNSLVFEKHTFEGQTCFGSYTTLVESNKGLYYNPWRAIDKGLYYNRVCDGVKG